MSSEVLSPARAATKRLKAPGSSGMLVAIMTSRRAPTSARSLTIRSRSKFMLAPLVMATTVCPRRSWCFRYALAPAAATAPAGSRMERVSLKTSLMAAQISSVLTSTTPSQNSRHTRNVSAPTVLTATPSAKLFRSSSVTRRPAARAVARQFESAGSTPSTLTHGATCLTKAATPARRPPPPTGTKMACRAWMSFTWRRISLPMVPWPQMTCGSSKGAMKERPSAAAASMA